MVIGKWGIKKSKIKTIQETIMINEGIKVIISVLGLGIFAIGIVVSILVNRKARNANYI